MDAGIPNAIDAQPDDTQSDRDVLRTALDTMPTPIFAVLDGCYFDDLKEELSKSGIIGRSLF
ncbi:hypothetical protein HED63_26680 [Ochrobactrum cytisi]|nr:hypothetical protein [Brucella cytisi]